MTANMPAPHPDPSEYKARLLTAAQEIIAQHGLDGLTAAKLAARLGLSRTVVHYHFGTMDHLLAALIRQSSAAIRADIAARFTPANIGDNIWREYSVAISATEAVRARALSSPVVAEAFAEVLEDLRRLLAGILEDAYRIRGIPPEIPTYDMALIMLMASQFAGTQRSLGGADQIAGLERYMRSLFAISAA